MNKKSFGAHTISIICISVTLFRWQTRLDDNILLIKKSFSNKKLKSWLLMYTSTKCLPLEIQQFWLPTVAAQRCLDYHANWKLKIQIAAESIHLSLMKLPPKKVTEFDQKSESVDPSIKKFSTKFKQDKHRGNNINFLYLVITVKVKPVSCSPSTIHFGHLGV